MEHFIITMVAKPGEADKVAKYYQNIGPDLETAKGFLGRTVMQSRPGAMAHDVRQRITPEEMAKHPPHDHESGQMFVIHEKWESMEDRWNFSSNLKVDRRTELFPYIEQAHTHEYYDDVTN